LKKFFRHIICLVLVLVTALGYGQEGTIKGTVRGAEGILVGATVSVENKTSLTDRNGEFSFTLKAGIHSFIVTHAGYEKIVREVKTEAQITIVDFVMTPIEQMGEVVVLGSRSLIQRSNLSTPVPVDVFTFDDLVKTGRPGLTQMLNFTAPSFNSSRELLNESVTLRGLNPDQSLILLNGTRYHNMAFIQADAIRGHVGKGSVANDLNSIPFSAIEKFEILRDGATAQYGSDAIAGVINIILKKSVSNSSIQFHSGQYYKGDGENINVGIHHGISFGKSRKGFLNLSADLRYRNHTYRGGTYLGTVYTNNPIIDDSLVLARNFNRTYPSNAGNSKLKGFGILINGGYQFDNKTELFWMAAFNSRKNRFIGTFTFPKIMNFVNDSIFPNGFKSFPIQYSRDVSAIAGAKGNTKNKWYWEYSSAYGSNTGIYKPENTNNASQYYTLGKNAPTKFYTGTLVYRQLTNSVHFTKAFSKKTHRFQSFNVGYGLEWRLENYQIKEGEEAAWQNYDTLGRKAGGAVNALILHHDNVVNEFRNVLGTYVDVEMEFPDQLFLNLAGRYEYYDDFGGNLAGKMAIRYKISDRFSLRGSVSNGFRAPTMQHYFYSTTSNGVARIDGNLVAVTNGIYRNNSELAKAMGIPALEAEKSINLATGFMITFLNRISLTMDAYWIQIKDRLVHSGSFDRQSNASIDSLFRKYNLPIRQAAFFSNAINTRTQGMDIVLNTNWRLRNTKLSATLAANFTRTRLFGKIKLAENIRPDSLNTNTLFNRREKMRMEQGQPDHKIILLVQYKIGKLDFILRNTRFGKTSITSFDKSNDPSLDEFFSPKIITDISINYSLQKWVTITAGATNVFDIYPDRLKNYLNTNEGQFIYAQEASPFGFNGGYYFVSMAFNF